TALRSELELLFKHSGEIAVNAKQPVSIRLAAISLLGQAQYSIADPALQALIEPQQPSEVQTAAIRALGRFSGPDVGAALVTGDRWNSYTPAVRDVPLSALMSSTNSLQALFTAIEKGDVPAWTVNADRRNMLMKQKDEVIRTRANALFK